MRRATSLAPRRNLENAACARQDGARAKCAIASLQRHDDDVVGKWSHFACDSTHELQHARKQNAQYNKTVPLRLSVVINLTRQGHVPITRKPSSDSCNTLADWSAPADPRDIAMCLGMCVLVVIFLNVKQLYIDAFNRF